MRLVLLLSLLMLLACGDEQTPASPSPEPAADSNHPLQVTVEGAGRVVSTPAGLDCDSQCSGRYATDSQVSLTAQPAAGQVFTGWSGDCSGSLACTLTLNSARSVTARFAPVGDLTACELTRSSSSSSTASFAEQHPRVLLNHAATLDCLRRLLATGHDGALRFQAWVDRALDEPDLYGFEPWQAALLYRVGGDRRYAQLALQRTEAFVSAEEALIGRGERPTVSYDSYLEVGPKVGGVMLVYDWCHDLLSPAQRQRWLAYSNQAVWNVWNPDDAQWGGRPFAWSGWAIDNPANNYYYSFLRATMLLGLASRGEHPGAEGWITRFRTDKLQRQLFPQFERDGVGGGSREGTGYGTALKGLWMLYDWWERSTGERIATLTSHTLASLPHFVHSVAPTLDRLAPTGDHARDSTAALFDYHREYLLGLISLFPSERVAGVAADLLARSTQARMTYGFEAVFDFLNAPPRLPLAALEDLSTTYWGEGTGQLAMRSSWRRDAAWANFICGPYDADVHAHRDQGSFVLFQHDWLAWDGNIASLSGIEAQEEMHNLVRLRVGDRSIEQVAGAPRCRMLALADNTDYTYALADVTPVYNGQPEVRKVHRAFVFLKPGTFVVFDRVQTAEGVTRIFTLNLPAAPVISGGSLSLQRGSARLDAWRLAPDGLATQWVDGARAEVADATGSDSQFLHVIGLGGAVTSAVRSDAAGLIGTRITWADGRVAELRFSAAGTGGSLRLLAADGATLRTEALATTVVTPPWFVR